MKKNKDWYIQGLQLLRAYEEDWDEIKSTFSSYGLKLSQNGPILTINELKNIRLAKEITESLIVNPEVRKLATHGIVVENENDIKGRIFLLVLRIFPEFCRQVGTQVFESWLGKSDGQLKELFELDGTMKEIDSNIEKIIEGVLFLGKDKKFKNLKKVK